MCSSGGHAVEHLDPVISAFSEGHRRRRDLPSAQIPELFRLMRTGPLLDALESLLGPEIDGSPVYHLNFKLAEPHQALACDTARRLGLPDPTLAPITASMSGRRSGTGTPQTDYRTRTTVGSSSHGSPSRKPGGLG